MLYQFDFTMNKNKKRMIKPRIKRVSLFQKLFILTFLVASIPLGFSWLYFFAVERGMIRKELSDSSLIFYGLLFFALILAIFGAFYFSKNIIGPIAYFKRAALEIARGNFSQKVRINTHDEIGQLAKIFNFMTEELRRLQKKKLHEVYKERHQTKIILKNIADGVIVTDESNHIILMNPVAMDWFGFKNYDQFLAKSIDQVIPNEELVQLVNKLKETEVREINTTEILLKGSDGWKKVILQARATNIFDEEENRWSGVVTVLRDITKEKEIDRMKTELVSMVAHELRSPLTSISGFSELLLDPNTAPEQTREYATIILKESNRLNELINKFLDISKIESGKIQMRKIPVDLKLLIAKVLEYNGQLANKKNIQVEIKAPPHISEVMVDKDMMEQVVLNLFSNAVKYSPENARITIRVFENKNNVGFEVEDTGYGIPENALPRIFDKFYRVSDNEQVQEVQGSGLGLALVKQIVEIHNGDIRVQSSVGEGSTFTVTLPKTATTTPKKLDDMMIV